MDKTMKSRRRTFLKVTGVGTLGLLGCGDDDGSDGGVLDGGRDAAMDAAMDAGRLADGAVIDVPTDAPPVEDAGPVVDDGLSPILSDFHIIEAQPSRVYFASSEPLRGSTTTGFFVSDNEVTGLVLNGRSLTGHYFTVETPFDFWDNSTIRYGEFGNEEPASDLRDWADNPVYPFTLSYIENRMDEPAADTLRYVTTGADGGGDGSEESPWTIAEAFDSAEPGMTVWIKAGDYGNQELGLSVEGTADNPVKFIGYKETPGDITSNYFDYEVTWNASEMPTLTGASASDGEAIALRGAHYVILRNLQITNYFMGIRANNTHNTYLHFDRMNGRTFGGSGDSNEDINGSFIVLTTLVAEGSGDRPWTSNSHLRVRDSRCVNATMGAFTLFGDGRCLVDGSKSYNDRITEPQRQDYHISVNGHHNIVRGCHCENFNNTTTNVSTHGIGVRGSSNLDNTYNLIELSVAINVMDSFYIRNFGCEYNVIKDCVASNNGNHSGENVAGVWIMGGSNYNIIERVTVSDMTFCGIGFTDNQEEGNTDDTTIGHDNLIRNCVFNDTKYAVYSGGSTDSALSNNTIAGCTFNNSQYLFKRYNTVVTDLRFVGCNFTDFRGTPGNGFGAVPFPEGLVFSYCNFFNFRNVDDDAYMEPGEGNVSIDPLYVSDTDLHLSAASPSEVTQGGQMSDLLRFDFDGKKRTAPFSIGAYEWDA